MEPRNGDILVREYEEVTRRWKESRPGSGLTLALSHKRTIIEQ